MCRRLAKPREAQAPGARENTGDKVATKHHMPDQRFLFYFEKLRKPRTKILYHHVPRFEKELSLSLAHPWCTGVSEWK